MMIRELQHAVGIKLFSTKSSTNLYTCTYMKNITNSPQSHLHTLETTTEELILLLENKMAMHRANGTDSARAANALNEEIKHGNVKEVESLLARMEASVKAGVVSYALQEAATHGRNEIVQILLTRGADLKFKNSYGATCLHLATAGGQTGTVRILLESGANCCSFWWPS